MDKIIKKYACVENNGLCYCVNDDVAYQKDMTKSVPYDQAYFDKYVKYENSVIGKNLNRARVDAVKAWAKNLLIIDIGVGCGSFIKLAIKESLNVFGFDVNKKAVLWLKRLGLFENPYTGKRKIFCFTFWDSLEHIPDPQKILDKIQLGSFVFISIPIFDDLGEVIKSKHYRPDEHYYYFTSPGLIKWMKTRSFKLVRKYNFENECGREGILTFLFEKTPDIKSKTDGLYRRFFSKQKKESDAFYAMINGR